MAESYSEHCQTSKMERFSIILSAKSCKQFSQNTPSYMFDWV